MPSMRAWRIVVALGLSALVPGAVAGMLYTVTTKADGAVVDGNCTLREAIRAAVQDAAVDQCAAGEAVDTIVLSSSEAGSYVFSQGDEAVISAGVVDLTIRGDAAEPASAHAIDFADANRFLRVFPGHRVTLENLWLLSGRAPVAADYGGALIANDCQLTLRDVAVFTSSAHSGGALYFNNTNPAGSLRLERVVFEFNLARDGSPPGEPEGGAVVASVADGDVEIVDVTFRGNEATSVTPGAGVAGAMRLLVGGIGRASLRRVLFENNQARTYGALHLRPQFFAGDAGATVLEDVTFRGNSLTAPTGVNATAWGAEVRGSSRLSARRVRVTGNNGGSALPAEMVISAQENATVAIDDLLVAGGDGRGLLLAAGDTVTLLAGHLTVANNFSTGIGMFAAGGATARLENSIAWGNGFVAPDDLDTFGTSPSVDPLVNHNLIGELGGADPQFVDLVGGDFDLLVTSPARDAGDRNFASVGTLDLAHRPRIVGPQPDLGALERGGLFGDGFESGDGGAWRWQEP